MVDRCILDEIGDFLSSVLTQPFEDSPQFFTSLEKAKKETKAKRKTKNKGRMVKEVKAPKRQYNRKQPTKAMLNSVVERLSPSSPGSSTTDTSSTCSAGDNITWKKPKRGVGRPPLCDQIPKKKRMKLHHYAAKTAAVNTPRERISGTLPKRQTRLPGIFSNYLMEPQHLSINTGTMSTLGAMRANTSSTLMKVTPPTIPSAASAPNLGSFEAPRGFIARMEAPQTSTTCALASSPRLIASNIKTKPKNVTFMTGPATPNSGAPTTSIPSPICSSSSSNIASISMDTASLETKPSVAPRQILVQKKLSDLSQIQSLVQKSQNVTKVPQPVQLLSLGNKIQTKMESLSLLIGNSQSFPNTSLLQSALSVSNKSPVSLASALSSPLQTVAPTGTTVSQVATTQRKMQVITFLKPPPNSVSKPIIISSSEKETEKDLVKTSDSPPPKVIRTYGDIKLNRQLAALKQQQQQSLDGHMALSDDSFPDALTHLSMGTQEAVFALTQLSTVPQMPEN